jgi:hypothetical protein
VSPASQSERLSQQAPDITPRRGGMTLVVLDLRLPRAHALTECRFRQAGDR